VSEFLSKLKQQLQKAFSDYPFLAALDLSTDSRARVSHLLHILPDNFPRTEACEGLNGE